MRRPPALSRDPMTFSQALAAGLRAEFADALSAPLPDEMATLLHRLSAGPQEDDAAEGGEHGPSAAKTSSRPYRRG
jgi:hypothetical protein